jgi:hypothetical protein
MSPGPLGLLGELQPLACQLFILALELEIADVARELPAFCRMGAELFGTGLHMPLFDAAEHFPGIHRRECNRLDSGARPPCPMFLQ